MGTSLLLPTKMAKTVKPTSEHKGFARPSLLWKDRVLVRRTRIRLTSAVTRRSPPSTAMLSATKASEHLLWRALLCCLSSLPPFCLPLPPPCRKAVLCQGLDVCDWLTWRPPHGCPPDCSCYGVRPDRVHSLLHHRPGRHLRHHHHWRQDHHRG